MRYDVRIKPNYERLVLLLNDYHDRRQGRKAEEPCQEAAPETLPQLINFLIKGCEAAITTKEAACEAENELA